MKNIMKNSLVLVVLFSTFLANANSFSKVYDDGSNTTITLSNLKQGNEIFVKDADGSTLYSETIKVSGDYIKNFDLTKLPNGNYYFEINKGLEIKMIHFTVEEAVAVFEKENETVIFKPFVTSDENLVSVSKLSLNEQPLEINIYFDDNGFNLIHSETIDNTQNISRIYSLNKAKKGDYRIVTKTDGRTFVDYVRL